VTKVSDRQLLVQLSESLVGAVELIDLADDYTQADPSKHGKNDIVRACIIRVDAPNKKISLSLRPSRVLSSSMTVIDPEITNLDQLKVNDIYSGFIRNVDDKGIFVTLGHGITAFVRISHLSDSYIKEWKDSFQRDQLVKGKITSVDKTSGHVQMSLKASILGSDYVPPLAFSDLKVGDTVTGKVAKVHDFGVFISVDNSENIRGLCHRSELAEQRIEDASKIFSEGDVVKAKVLKVEPAKRHVNFGMKASYFSDHEEDSGDEIDADDDTNKGQSDSEEGGALLGEADLEDGDSRSNPDEDISESDSEIQIAEEENETKQPNGVLKLGGFDWYGVASTSLTRKRTDSESEDDAVPTSPLKKRKKKRAEIQIDRTGDLDANGPQSTDDYERLLLGSPDSSLLWLQYMAFHLELGDIDQARSIGERALKSINISHGAEKMNVWVALFNLENAYGDDESVESIFKRACEYNDPQEMYSRLTSIYIQSGKHQKADEMFQRMLKKFTQDPRVWINYGTFLFDSQKDAGKGREILPRALQILPKFTHFDVTLKFAQLEFKSPLGLAERGRTIFEGLISSFPKRVDLYNVLLDLEMKLGDKEQIRAVFERVFDGGGKLKAKQAKYFFKRWLTFEEKQGDERHVEDVKARAAVWVRSVKGDGDVKEDGE
jgi:rRNA biogenesis protein RRP5